MLLSHGARKDIRDTKENKTPFELAQEKGHHLMCKLLDDSYETPHMLTETNNNNNTTLPSSVIKPLIGYFTSGM